MTKYAILMNPGHNRVYFNATKKLAVSELNVALSAMNFVCENIAITDICGIEYVTFAVDKTLEDRELKILGRLSFAYAVFEVAGEENNISLRPVFSQSEKYLPDSMSSILKYTGKTNELFTRMMINVALMSAKQDINDANINLLDPIAGKGTTLYEALINGYNAYGVEIGDKPVAEAFAYVKKFLITEKVKHDSKSERVSGAGKSFRAKRYTITLAKTKEEYKQSPKVWEMISGDSSHSDTYFRKNFFDIIVGDLPYGVQHSNVTNENQSSFTRNPSELIRVCAKSWHTVLKEGGVIVLAWNSLLLSKQDFAKLLEKVGFKVLTGGVYDEFEHRVDNSILRDIIVAIK